MSADAAMARMEARQDSYEPKLEGPCPDCGRMSLEVTRYVRATMQGPAERDMRCTADGCEWQT